MLGDRHIFPDLDLNGTFLGIWLAHTAFGLPLAIYLLRNYIGSLPSSIIESAKIDGADHFTIFWRLIIPLSVPALAAFAIFQFLWVWNDLLVAYVFLGGTRGRTACSRSPWRNLVGATGENWHLLTAAAFISMVAAARSCSSRSRGTSCAGSRRAPSRAERASSREGSVLAGAEPALAAPEVAGDHARDARAGARVSGRSSPGVVAVASDEPASAPAPGPLIAFGLCAGAVRVHRPGVPVRASARAPARSCRRWGWRCSWGSRSRRSLPMP